MDGVIEWLYEHASGNISVVVSLIHDAQEIAILDGRECLNLEGLNETYQKRLSLLHGFINVKQKSQTSKTKKKQSTLKLSESEEAQDNFTIFDLAATAKSDGVDIVGLLKDYMPVVEVKT